MRIGEGVRGQAKPEQPRLQILREEVRRRAGAEAIDAPSFGDRVGAAFKIGCVKTLAPVREHRRHAAGHVAHDILSAGAEPHRAVQEGRAKRQRADSFAARIASQPKLFVVGGEDDLA